MSACLIVVVLCLIAVVLFMFLCGSVSACVCESVSVRALACLCQSLCERDCACV